MAERDVSMLLVDGVEGPSVYINDYRVAGPKPWGGGRIVRQWKVSREDIETALGRKPVVTDPMSAAQARAGVRRQTERTNGGRDD